MRPIWKNHWLLFRSTHSQKSPEKRDFVVHTHLCSTKSYKTQKAQDLVGLVLFCCHILWFAPFAEYLNLGAAFS